MVMTKKHYKFFAECISDIANDRATLEHIEERMMQFFYEDNKNFNAEVFKCACK